MLWNVVTLVLALALATGILIVPNSFRDGIDYVIDFQWDVVQRQTVTLSLVEPEAARAIGMSFVPLLCAQEIPVPGAMPRCLRILLHVNTEVSPRDIEHVYLRDAQRLRPDLKSAQ